MKNNKTNGKYCLVLKPSGRSKSTKVFTITGGVEHIKVLPPKLLEELGIAKLV